MKRFWICLLALTLLAGCGAENQDLEEAAQTSAAEEAAVTMQTERNVYDASVESVWYIIENHSGRQVEFGTEYGLERQEEDGSWIPVPYADDVAWTTPLCVLADGAKNADHCYFSIFDYDFSGGGTFRIVKEVGDQTLTAEFRLEPEAAASAEAPYGFGPMEDLPENWDPVEAAEIRTVVFTEAGAENLDLAEEFLEKVSLGIPCQLRSLQSYYESWPMLIDVIYENDSFLWRMRTGGEITEQRFSYIVTDGTDVYLSNGADWDSTERYDSDKAFLLPSGSGGDLVPAAQELMGDQTAGSTVRYRIWSADGVWDASLTETPTEFGVGWQRPGEGSGGSLYDLGDWYDEELSIAGIIWEDDGTLSLTCETAAGGAIVPTFDPETGILTEVMRGDPAAE